MGNLCGEHHYGNITKVKINKILDELRKSGATITGNNPWDVDVHSNGVKLQGSWVESTSTLTIIVTDKSWYVPCSAIWNKIDPLINHISSLQENVFV